LGKYKNGERLQQGKLSSLYEMSRTPIRDALIRLESEGYVTRDESAGYKVSEIDVSDYIEFWEFRRYLESKVASLAASNITEHQLNELKNNLERLLECGKEGEFLDIFHCDEEFHDIIINACGNKYYRGIFDLYKDKIKYYRYLYQRQVNAVMIYNGHYKIYKAFEKHDVEEARHAMYQHMNMFMEHLRNKLKYTKDNA
jgi:DNA-binding GntR family transcriptional regulator